ncbi:MAG: hypothetical protein V1784_03710, partial [bacterium]
MERYVEQLGIPPIDFDHGLETEILSLFDLSTDKWTNVFICGEAGGGKTRMIHKIQRETFGQAAKKSTCWREEGQTPKGTVYCAHINRDLSASRKFGASDSLTYEKEEIRLYSSLILGKAPEDGIHRFFVIAANDGQLLSAWKDHANSCEEAARALKIIEHTLQTGNAPEGVPMRLFHLSSLRTKTNFERCMDALLDHPGWQTLEKEHSGATDIFSPTSHLRRNRDALRDPIIRSRLLDLARLCEANDWHFPVRNMLALLANAILGKADRKIAPSGVMNLDQLRTLAAEQAGSGADFFSSILCLNLDPEWREKTLGAIESFRVGYETLNIADGLILFGPEPGEDYTADHKSIFCEDPIFPPDEDFEQLRCTYLNAGPSDDPDSPFHEQLVAQRRRLFFRTPQHLEAQYDPWRLTNFHHAREYLDAFLDPADAGKAPSQRELHDLVLGLNRVWTGLLLEESDDLFLATALDYASAPFCEIEVARIRTRSASGGMTPYVSLDGPSGGSLLPSIAVYFLEDHPPVTMRITLTRFEFLKRVAGGALP